MGLETIPFFYSVNKLHFPCQFIGNGKNNQRRTIGHREHDHPCFHVLRRPAVMKPIIPDDTCKGHQQRHGNNNECSVDVLPEFIFYSHKNGNYNR